MRIQKNLRARSVCIACGLGIAAFSHAGYDSGSWELWTKACGSYAFDQSFQMNAEVETKTGDDLREVYSMSMRAGFYWRINETLKLGGLYKQEWEKKGDHWGVEERPALEGDMQQKIAGWKVSTRARLEYRFRNLSDDGFRFRCRWKVNTPWCWTEWKINPYASEEFFFAFYNNRMDQNRISTGVEFRPCKHLKGDLFYMARQFSVDDGGWWNNHVLGVSLGLDF